MISVSDNGEGMDRETQARIFEPFFTTKEKGKGTGLGLSTVYGIIKQSGGYVFVQSELGRGTVFTIYFPRVDEPSEAIGATPVALAAAGGTETVLLVEDEDSVRQLVRETLESRGYRVLEAANGSAALALAAAHSDPIHLVITDVVMPGLSGHELVQQLLPTRPGLKVLYLSGYAQDAFPSHRRRRQPENFPAKTLHPAKPNPQSPRNPRPPRQLPEVPDSVVKHLVILREAKDSCNFSRQRSRCRYRLRCKISSQPHPQLPSSVQ